MRRRLCYRSFRYRDGTALTIIDGPMNLHRSLELSAMTPRCPDVSEVSAMIYWKLRSRWRMGSWVCIEKMTYCDRLLARHDERGTSAVVGRPFIED